VTRPVYRIIDATIGNTPLVQLRRLPGAELEARGVTILGKLEGNNPGGSVKDRPVLSMFRRAEERGEIRPGDRLIEATSGNTGIAMAMIAAMTGYRMTLIMPDNLSAERRASMTAYGAEARVAICARCRPVLRSSARNRAKARRSRVYASGPRPISRRSISPPVSTGSSSCHRRRPKGWRVAWRPRKVSSVDPQRRARA
jgi:cysteine synthase